MLALSDAVRSGAIPKTEIVLVVSDKPDAPGLALAQKRELKTAVVERRGLTRQEHDGKIISLLREHQTDLICLAGYMRLLSKSFVEIIAAEFSISIRACFLRFRDSRRTSRHSTTE